MTNKLLAIALILLFASLAWINIEFVRNKRAERCNITIPKLTADGWCKGYDENKNVVYKKDKFRIYIE